MATFLGGWPAPCAFCGIAGVGTELQEAPPCLVAVRHQGMSPGRVVLPLLPGGMWVCVSVCGTSRIVSSISSMAGCWRWQGPRGWETLREETAFPGGQREAGEREGGGWRGPSRQGVGWEGSLSKPGARHRQRDTIWRPGRGTEVCLVSGPESGWRLSPRDPRVRKGAEGTPAEDTGAQACHPPAVSPSPGLLHRTSMIGRWSGSWANTPSGQMAPPLIFVPI